MNDRVLPTTIGNAAASGGRFAIVYTVRNEAALLPHAIAFHAAAGCSRFYVYWDGTTDAAPTLLRSRDDVVARDSVRPEHATGLGSLRVDPGRWNEDMHVRKRINALHAATVAAADGIEWLLSIDPDELLLADARDAQRNDGGVARIDRMLASIADGVDQVLVPNLEVAPIEAPVGLAFTDRTLFLTRRPIARLVAKALGRAALHVIRRRRAAAWIEHGVHRLASFGRFPPIMRDPRTGHAVPRGRYLGYHSYKAFIRSSRADRFDFAVHRWIAGSGGRPRTVRRGVLLHYDLVGADAFAAKFRQRVLHAESFSTARLVLAQLAQEMDDDALRAFYAREIALPEPVVARLIASGEIMEVRGPAAFFAR